MNRTFVWGHRGAGFKGIQNTISSFQNAIDMGVDGIKTEAQISKDREIFLTFQQNLKINGENIPVKELDSYKIKEFKLENGESIPTLPELFNKFKKYKIRYNFDIRAPEVGIRIIEITRDFDLIDKIEIAKTSIDPYPLPVIFSKIREFDKNVSLINSIFLKYSPIEEKHLELESMRKLKIHGINVNYNFANFELFKKVVDKGFKFYVWGVLFNRSMEKFLKMNYQGKVIDAMMSNFPERLVKLRNKIQNN
ncbi:MAG: hypothetical protein JSV23_07055 [Promethearchaeota archaeon]|nr:MAG: hypothetical protein JSV23_07055 [Candidatus Lokiarchaeota archaeon]